MANHKSDIASLWLTGILVGMALALRPQNRPPPASQPNTEIGDPRAMRGVLALVTVKPTSRWQALKVIVLAVYRELPEDRLIAVAAGIVLYALLAIFPALTALVAP